VPEAFPFVHDIRAIRVISGYTFGCGEAALGNPRSKSQDERSLGIMAALNIAAS
jgi:hypothetical protein